MADNNNNTDGNKSVVPTTDKEIDVFMSADVRSLDSSSPPPSTDLGSHPQFGSEEELEGEWVYLG
jgi:hypothetical protein